MAFTSCTDTFTLRNAVGIPCIGYGTFETPADTARKAVREALEVGYRHIRHSGRVRQPAGRRRRNPRQRNPPSIDIPDQQIVEHRTRI